MNCFKVEEKEKERSTLSFYLVVIFLVVIEVNTMENFTLVRLF